MTLPTRRQGDDRLVRRVLGFVLLPLLSAVSPILALPVVTRVAGSEGWAAIAIGQSMGLAASVAVEYGWSVSGPSASARASAAGRRHLYWLSTAMRSTLYLAVVPVAVVVAAVLAPATFRGDAGLMAASIATVGLSPAWFFIGTGRPGAIALYDAVPRVAATAVAAVLVAATGQLRWYPLLTLLVGFALAVIVPFRIGGRPGDLDERLTAETVRRQLRSQGNEAAIRIVTAGYVSLPVTLLAAVAPSAVPVFAAVDRLQKLALTGLQPVSNAFQGWVVEAGSSAFVKRRRTAVLVNVVVAAASATGFVLVAPYVGRLLFSGTVETPLLLVVLSATTVAIICTTRSTGSHVLVPLRRARSVLVSVVVGAAVGVPLVLVLGVRDGATGAMWAVLLSEAGVLLVQLAWLRRIRGEPLPEATASP